VKFVRYGCGGEIGKLMEIAFRILFILYVIIVPIGVYFCIKHLRLFIK